MAEAAPGLRQVDGKISQMLGIMGRLRGAGCEALGEVRKLYPQDGGLDFVEPLIEAFRDVVEGQARAGELHVARPGLPIGGDHLHALRQCLIRGHAGAAAPQRAEMLRGREAEAGDVREMADTPLVDGAAEGEAGILDDENPMRTGDLEDFRQIGGVAEEVDRQDGFRARGQGPLEGRDIHGQRRLVHVDEDRSRSDGMDCRRGRDIAVGNRDDLVTWTDAERLQRDPQGGRAGVHADHMRDAEPFRECALEGRHLLAPIGPAAQEHPPNRSVELRLTRAVEFGVVVERDRHR
jgi:hypothetical protein